MDVYRFHQGASPLLVSIPHAGTHVPPDIEERLSPEARTLPDTDWHVDRLYDFAAELGASVLLATHSRYVIDLNRPPDDEALYPGLATTGLCPTTLFDGRPLYREAAEPDESEIAERRDTYWQPYHDRLRSEIDRIRDAHGLALLYDAHSIRSRVPRLFDGQLPDLNLGTADSSSCAARLESRLAVVLADAEGFDWDLNGRFIGGYITRHYGAPASGVHAVQMELSQITYMEEDPPYTYLDERADRVRPVLRRVLEEMLAWGGAKARLP